MKNSSFFFALLAGTFLITGCGDKNLPTILPPATQDGENTLGFKINGRIWTA